MKVSVSRDELVQKLSIVSRAVSARTTVLVLGGILLLSAPAIGDDAEPVRVTFHAPSDCPSAASFFAAAFIVRSWSHSEACQFRIPHVFALGS